MTLAEVIATSDVPGGVVNILTGDPAEIAPHLAAHADVNALDLTGTSGALRTDLERAAAGTVKRVYAPRSGRGLRGTARHRPAAGVPGDQDRVAPDRRGVAGRWRRLLTGAETARPRSHRPRGGPAAHPADPDGRIAAPPSDDRALHR